MAGAVRYDRIYEGYSRHWAPVLEPWSLALLDRLAAAVPSLADRSPDRTGRTAHVIDIGTGTGPIARAAVERWPGVEVTAVDASGEMLAITRAVADRELPAEARSRLRTVAAFAEDLPFGDGSADGALAAFVLQLVSNRRRSLGEIARVVRPGGWFGHVTWLVDEREFAGDAVTKSAYRDLGLAPRGEDGRTGDFASPRAAADAMRRAGFAAVQVEPGMLVHTWSAAAYLDFLMAFEDEDRFATMPPDLRARVSTALLERLGELSESDLTMRLPIVYAIGRRR